METADTTASLLDDLDFLEEIEKLEARPRAGMTDVSPDQLQAWAGQPQTRPLTSSGPQFIMPAETAEPSAEATRSPLRPVLAAAGFVLMVSIGAGAAALMFHERVTQIVTQWNGAR